MGMSFEHNLNLVWNCEHSRINPLTSNDNFSYLLSFAFYLQLSCVIIRKNAIIQAAWYKSLSVWT